MAAPPEGSAGATNQVMKVRYADVDDSNFALHGRAVPMLAGLLALALVALVAACLYLNWACNRRHRRHRADLEATAASAVLAGLDADAINALPVTLYSPTRSNERNDGGGEEEQAAEAECSICISALVAGEKVKALPPCGHRFHPGCVDDWLRSHPSCPLCRTTLLPVTSAKQDAC
ncbi:RING-H2 finger protein ATL66-like [Lolium rigidum]|uniref:RING-H2 finger protein ATL66-like n=1 Tax=Lolium rigidum TaxID=89674 RepID=UPI001F5CC577|nr:RING-H2 finger protein ATL66-like [Lolium rigidum]